MTDVLTILKQAGFRGPALRTAWAIVQRESKGNPRAYNPNRATGDDSYGLFQVNMLGQMGADRRRQYGLASNEDLYDPLTNARVAYRMSKGGRDFGAWGVGANAYRQTAPLDYSGYPGPGGKTQPARAAQPTYARAVKPRTISRLKDLDLIARQYGFKSFAQAYGIPAKQARQLAQVSVMAMAPTGKPAFRAKPSPRLAAKVQSSARGGVAELFYDPAGKGEQWDQGNWINPIGGHADHVHVSFSKPETALHLIQIARDMGLRVGENPYTDPVDPSVHVATSFHKRTFAGSYGGRQLGEAIDVSGPAALMMRFYEAARAYVAT